MGRVLAILFLIVTLAGAGLVVLMLREQDALKARLVSTEAELKRSQSEAASLRAERDQLRNDLVRKAPAAPPAAAQGTVAGTAPPSGDSAKKAAPNPAAQSRKAFAEMLKNPAMKEVMKQQQLAALDMQYAGLFAKFQLSDAEKADFKTLLGERLMLEAELGLKMMGEDVTPDQRKAMLKEFEDGKKASDARIKDFLNSDADFASFQQWEDTKPERMQLDMGRSLFATSGEPLTPQQEQQLVDTMHQVRKAPKPTADLSRPENFDPAKLNQAEMERQLARMDADAQQVSQAAAQFLTPGQLESFRKLQAQWRAMAETGLRMSVMMFDSGKAGAAK